MIPAAPSGRKPLLLTSKAPPPTPSAAADLAVDEEQEEQEEQEQQEEQWEEQEEEQEEKEEKEEERDEENGEEEPPEEPVPDFSTSRFGRPTFRPSTRTWPPTRMRAWPPISPVTGKAAGKAGGKMTGKWGGKAGGKVWRRPGPSAVAWSWPEGAGETYAEGQGEEDLDWEMEAYGIPVRPVTRSFGPPAYRSTWMAGKGAGFLGPKGLKGPKGVKGGKKGPPGAAGFTRPPSMHEAEKRPKGFWKGASKGPPREVMPPRPPVRSGASLPRTGPEMVPPPPASSKTVAPPGKHRTMPAVPDSSTMVNPLCVKITGLPSFYSHRDVEGLCSQYGLVTEVQMLSGTAVVSFKESSAARSAAKAVNGRNVPGAGAGAGFLRAELCDAVKLVEEKAKEETKEEEESSAQRMVLHVDELQLATGDPSGEECEVFLRDLPYDDCTEEELKGWLSGFGDVKEVTFLRDTISGEPSGKGYARYSLHSEAKDVIQAFPSGTDGDVQASWSLSERLHHGAEGALQIDAVGVLISRLPQMRKQTRCPTLTFAGEACQGRAGLDKFAFEAPEGPQRFAWLREVGTPSVAEMRGYLNEILAEAMAGKGVLKAEIAEAAAAAAAVQERHAATMKPQLLQVKAENENGEDDIAKARKRKRQQEGGEPRILVRGFPGSWKEQQMKLVFALFGGAEHVEFSIGHDGGREAQVQLKDPAQSEKVAERLHNTQVGDGELIETCKIFCEFLGTKQSEKEATKKERQSDARPPDDRQSPEPPRLAARQVKEELPPAPPVPEQAAGSSSAPKAPASSSSSPAEGATPPPWASPHQGWSTFPPPRPPGGPWGPFAPPPPGAWGGLPPPPGHPYAQGFPPPLHHRGPPPGVAPRDLPLNGMQDASQHGMGRERERKRRRRHREDGPEGTADAPANADAADVLPPASEEEHLRREIADGKALIRRGREAYERRALQEASEYYVLGIKRILGLDKTHPRVAAMQQKLAQYVSEAEAVQQQITDLGSAPATASTSSPHDRPDRGRRHRRHMESGAPPEIHGHSMRERGRRRRHMERSRSRDVHQDALAEEELNLKPRIHLVSREEVEAGASEWSDT